MKVRKFDVLGEKYCKPVEDERKMYADYGQYMKN